MTFATPLVAAALLSLAGAQAALPDRLRSSPSPKAAEQGRQVMMNYGRCIADAETELSRDFVLTDLADIDDPQWDRIVDNRCMRLSGGQLTMESYYFRGAIADRLIDRTLRDTALEGVAQLAPINATHPGSGPLAEHYTFMYRLGECIARTDPTGARALLDTRIDSGKEVDAIKALSPAIAGCVPEGRSMQIDRVRMRLGLATIYYRLAHALAFESEV